MPGKPLTQYFPFTDDLGNERPYLYSELEQHQRDILSIMQESLRQCNHYTFLDQVQFYEDDGKLVAQYVAYPILRAAKEKYQEVLDYFMEIDAPFYIVIVKADGSKTKGGFVTTSAREIELKYERECRLIFVPLANAEKFDGRGKRDLAQCEIIDIEHVKEIYMYDGQNHPVRRRTFIF